MPNIFYHSITPDEINKLDKMTPEERLMKKAIMKVQRIMI